MEKLWKQFEQLVSRIEETLLPNGATIKSPDRIKDLSTGKMREVDASIRMKIGTSNCLVVIECRRRKHKQDITWIEQLASKKRNIGADKIIAVAINGFTDEASKYASLNGIELRTINEISPLDITNWVLPLDFINVMRVVTIKTVKVTYSQNNKDETFLSEELDDEYLFDINDKVIEIPFIVSQLEGHYPEVFFSAPLDGTETKTFTFSKDLNQDKEIIYFRKNSRSGQVKKLAITLEVGYEHTKTNATEGKHYVYKNEKDLQQVSEYEIALAGLKFNYRFQGDPSEKDFKTTKELIHPMPKKNSR